MLINLSLHSYIPCWYSNLAKAGDGSHQCQDKKTPHNAWMHGGFHPVTRKWKEGSQGLVSVKATILDETTKIQKRDGGGTVMDREASVWLMYHGRSG